MESEAEDDEDSLSRISFEENRKFARFATFLTRLLSYLITLGVECHGVLGNGCL